MADDRIKRGMAEQTLIPKALGGAPDTQGRKRTPKAVIDAPKFCEEGAAVTLDGSRSTGFNGSDSFGLSRWEWEVDDASFVEGDPTTPSPSVEWHGPGPRTVRLTVTDEDGCRDTAWTIVLVPLRG